MDRKTTALVDVLYCVLSTRRIEGHSLAIEYSRITHPYSRKALDPETKKHPPLIGGSRGLKKMKTF